MRDKNRGSSKDLREKTRNGNNNMIYHYHQNKKKIILEKRKRRTHMKEKIKVIKHTK